MQSIIKARLIKITMKKKKKKEKKTLSQRKGHLILIANNRQFN